MNIRNVREKLKHFGVLSIPQLAQVTEESKEELQFVIKELMHKGKVEEVEMEEFCGGGCNCSSLKSESCSTMDQLYRWITS